jgi:lambda repressor-like predicted transcriptional regulator
MSKGHIMRTASRFTRIAVAAGLVVTSGAAVFGLTSFASAQTGDTPAVVPAVTEDSVPALDRARPLAVAAEALGMTEAELRAELAAGKSIADVAEAKGIDVQTVIDALVARFTERAAEMVNKPGLPREGRDGRGRGVRGAGKVLGSEALTGLLDLTRAEIRDRLKAGSSLAAIAEAQGVSVEDLKATLIADVTAHLAQKVAAGEHTQAEADAKLAKFTANIDRLINAAPRLGGRGMRGGADQDMNDGAPSVEDGALAGI